MRRKAENACEIVTTHAYGVTCGVYDNGDMWVSGWRAEAIIVASPAHGFVTDSLVRDAIAYAAGVFAAEDYAKATKCPAPRPLANLREVVLSCV